jgi:hypothetical protein
MMTTITMTNLSRHVGILIFIMISAATAGAQGFEVFGSAGYGRTFRIDDNSPGDGVFWGFGAGFRPLPRLRFEGAVENLDVLSHPTDHVANILHPRASLVYEFSSSPIRPFIIAGAGAARIREIQTITFPAGVEIREERETVLALHFGGGVALQISPSVNLRPQVVVIPTIASRSNIHLIHTSVQISFGW